MVETTVVGVETIDAHRQVVRLALAVVRTLGVDHPVVAWRADVHIACCRNEVC